MDDFLGNDFVRALREAERIKPDDEKATSPVLYVAFGLLSLVLVCLFVAALVLPPLFTHTLIVRGIRTGRTAMLVVGLIMASLYFMLLVAAGRRVMSRPKQPPDESDPSQTPH